LGFHKIFLQNYDTCFESNNCFDKTFHNFVNSNKLIPNNFMKKLRLSFKIALMMICANSYAQNAMKLTNIAQQKNDKGWIEFITNKNIAPEQVFTVYKGVFGLTASDEMQLLKSENDQQGFSHYRYQQYFQDVPVEGAEYLIHSFGNKSVMGNGNIIQGLKQDKNPAISAQSAISKAIKYINAKKYMWEDAVNEKWIKYAKKDPSATYYPKANLVYIDKKFGKNPKDYILAYKVNVYATSPLSYKNVYVNAITGEIYHIMSLIKDGDVQGIAHTKYSGTQSVTADSTSSGVYRLRETDRCGIETYDMNTGTDYLTAVDFTDTDNIWQNVNPQKDEVATDAHFGAEKTYDFYLAKFGRYSYDDLNSPLFSYVHYDAAYDNAFWDGTKMTYGDGDGTTDGPLTALDVCGHEITHGVTEYTANLIYQDEPGALNEAFSDIFGAAIEFYAAPALGDWYVGEDFDLTTGGNGFRNMSNPNEDGQPDTYKGTNWYVGVMDNGGVHTNSGVANYWFYLLSEGGSGTNDIGNAFSVDSIGIDKASQIAYRALTVYLTNTSDYMDTRIASIQAANDLYGACSAEVIATTNAWYAVGIGQGIADNDVYISEVLSPKTACGLTLETVKVRMIYNGCNIPLSAGEKIYFYYRADASAIVADSLLLATALNAGDTIDFTFSVPADVQVIGTHTISCWLKYANDTVYSNDTCATYTFKNKLYQNSDIGVVKIISPVSECHMGNLETVTVKVGFFGCEFMPAGKKIPVAYRIDNGTPVYDTITTVYDFYPDSVITHSFSNQANLSTIGNHTIDAWTDLPVDSLNTNDALNGYVVKNPYAVKDTTIIFDEVNTSNNFIISTAHYGHAMVATATGHPGKIVKMTGGNAYAYINQLQFPDGTNTWTINDFLSAKVTFCVDASTWTTANMRFDLKQTYGKQAYEAYVGPGDYTVASNLRVMVNGSDQISPTFNPITASTDPFVSHFFNLDAYAGTKFTVTFETRNISNDTVIFIMDNAYLDNVKFMEHSDVGIADFNLNDHIKVYPNPVTDQLNVNFIADKSQSIQIQLIDLQGKVMQQQDENATYGQNQFRIDLTRLPAGIYFIRISTEMGVYNNKVVKQ
jgi:Zn-dependent metalloprotease